MDTDPVNQLGEDACVGECCERCRWFVVSSNKYAGIPNVQIEVNHVH